MLYIGKFVESYVALLALYNCNYGSDNGTPPLNNRLESALTLVKFYCPAPRFICPVLSVPVAVP